MLHWDIELLKYAELVSGRLIIPHFADTGEVLWFCCQPHRKKILLWFQLWQFGMSLSLWIRCAIQVSKKMPPQHWFTPLQCFVSNQLIFLEALLSPFPSLPLSYVDGQYLTEDDLFVSVLGSGEVSFCFSYWILLVGLFCSLLWDGNYWISGSS